MFRKPALAVLCVAFLMTACEKKEPEQAAPAPKPRVRPRVIVASPVGMAPVGQRTSVFISKTPVTVEQYLAFLAATEQAPPPRWQGVMPGTPEARAAAVGLTRRMADQYAAWSLRRLPTIQEWQLSASVVGDTPYPWPQGGADDEPGGPVFLVQDWLPGTDSETVARQRKAQVINGILAGYKAEIDRLRAELRGMVSRETARHSTQTEQLKPAFFAMLDKAKDLSEAQARLQGSKDALAVVRKIADEKGRLAGQLKATDMSPEEAEAAVKAYEDNLAAVRSKIQQTREQLENTTQKLQGEVTTLTKKLEQNLAQGTPEFFQTIAPVLTDAAAEIEDISQAVSLLEMLREACDTLADVAPPTTELPDIADIEKRAAELDKQLADVPAPDTGAMDEVQQKIERFGQAIGQEFLQEKLLFKELDELVELRARREALEARVEGLKGILRQSGDAGS